MWDRSLRWWDLRQRTNVTVEAENIGAITFAADGRTVATLSRDGRVSIWDVASRTMRTNIIAEISPVFTGSSLPLSLSPDGRIVALACQDDAIRLWDTESMRLIGMLIGHKQEVRTLAFAPDGKTIATGSDDSTLKFWNVATQQELVTLRRLGGAPRGLMFAPDGRSLVAGSSSVLPSGSMRIFRTPTLAEIDAQEAGNVETMNR
jgi:WD40 repeat protein